MSSAFPKVRDCHLLKISIHICIILITTTIIVCVHIHVCTMRGMWKSEGNFVGVVLSFYHVGPRGADTVRDTGDKCLSQCTISLSLKKQFLRRKQMFRVKWWWPEGWRTGLCVTCLASYGPFLVLFPPWYMEKLGETHQQREKEFWSLHCGWLLWNILLYTQRRKKKAIESGSSIS